LVEQPIRNRQVTGSSPVVGSRGTGHQAGAIKEHLAFDRFQYSAPRDRTYQPREIELKRISSLDGFRAISIIIVVLGHLLDDERVRFHQHFVYQGYVNGGLGVFIFFVISGYLITSLLLRDFDKSGSLYLGRFYYRRFFRIVPPLYAYILFVAVVGPFVNLRPDVRNIMTALTFTRNLDYHSRQFMFEHFWSLCIEEQFYLLWPVTLLITLHHKGRRGAANLAVALIILAPLFRLATFPLIHNPPFRRFVDGFLPGHMDALMFGCWAALAEGSRGFEILYRRITSLVWFLPIWFFGISQFLGLHFGSKYGLSIRQSLDGIAVLFMILWATRNPDSVVGRLLNWRPIIHIGVISYSIYIWQTWFLHPQNHTVFATLPWSLLFILTVSELSWCTVERASYYLRDKWEPIIFKPCKQSVAILSDEAITVSD
jgi:peptidoglycan/LPS O-acetylase OafA/YrhL